MTSAWPSVHQRSKGSYLTPAAKPRIFSLVRAQIDVQCSWEDPSSTSQLLPAHSMNRERIVLPNALLPLRKTRVLTQQEPQGLQNSPAGLSRQAGGAPSALCSPAESPLHPVAPCKVDLHFRSRLRALQGAGPV